MAELKAKTDEISTYIRNEGFNVVAMWQCEWKSEQSNNVLIREFLKKARLPHHTKKTMTQQEVLRLIRDGSLFGLVECDIHVPPALLEHFEEMPPIFKNTDISKDDIGEHMKTYAENEGLMKKPRRSLIGSMFGKKILLATPLIQWYLSHGLVIERIRGDSVSQNNCFRGFGEAVSDARRAGDIDTSNAILADTMKLLGNSAHGKTVTNQEKHRNVKICTDTNASQAVNDPHFRALHNISDGIYEVDMTKPSINMNLPIQIGFFVYQYAKLRMLEFYYDFLVKFIDPSDFQMCEMDTESAYLAISGKNIGEVVRPEERQAFEQEKFKWFPREDTAEHRAYDKRTPGLFKVEWEGEGIEALCSKTYYCFGAESKISL